MQNSHLGLQQAALEQNQRLMLVFVDELSERKTCCREQLLIKTPRQVAYQDTDLDHRRNLLGYSPGSLETSAFAQLLVPSGSHVALTDLQYFNVGKVPCSPSAMRFLGQKWSVPLRKPCPRDHRELFS